MDLFGVGPLEIILVLILIILVFGPEDLAKSGKKIGRFLSMVVKSDTWRAVKMAGREIRGFPNKLAREAEIESYLAENSDKTIAPPIPQSREEESSSPDKTSKDEERSFEDGLKAWTTPPTKLPAEENK